LAAELLACLPEGYVNLLLVLLLLLIALSLPTWPYSAGWTYYPSGGLGILLAVVLVLLLTRRRV